VDAPLLEWLTYRHLEMVVWWGSELRIWNRCDLARRLLFRNNERFIGRQAALQVLLVPISGRASSQFWPRDILRCGLIALPREGHWGSKSWRNFLWDFQMLSKPAYVKGRFWYLPLFTSWRTLPRHKSITSYQTTQTHWYIREAVGRIPVSNK